MQSCPSSALAVVGEAGTPKLFRLDPGACIGCGRCLEVCPEDALEWTLAPAALLTNRRGAVAPIDLLEQGRVREAVGG